MKETIDKVIRSGRFPFKSRGQSMLPILQPNDTLYFKKTPLAKIKVNDLVIVKKRNQLICHRVIYKKKNYLITKGDNVLKSDGKIYSKQIIGKVYQIKRNGQIFHPESLYLLQSTLYFKEIVKIKKAFEKEKINFVFLKGLPLHLYYEKTHPKRIYLDCDVLIDKKDFLPADKILIKKKYKTADLHWSKKIKDMQREILEVSYYKKINQFIIMIDIHLQIVDLSIVHLGHLNNLYPKKNIEQLTEKFLKTKRKVKINNEKFLILNTKYLILYLALHLFHHNFRGAFRYQYLNVVIKKEVAKNKKKKFYSQNLFAQIENISDKYRLKNFTYPVFYLLKKHYQTPLAKNFLHQIKPSNFLTLKLYNFKNLNIFDDEPRIRAGINRFKNLFYLSPNLWWKKIFVFTNPSVIYSVFWTLFAKLKNLLKKK